MHYFARTLVILFSISAHAKGSFYFGGGASIIKELYENGMSQTIDEGIKNVTSDFLDAYIPTLPSNIKVNSYDLNSSTNYKKGKSLYAHYYAGLKFKSYAFEFEYEKQPSNSWASDLTGTVSGTFSGFPFSGNVSGKWNNQGQAKFYTLNMLYYFAKNTQFEFFFKTGLSYLSIEIPYSATLEIPGLGTVSIPKNTAKEKGAALRLGIGTDIELHKYFALRTSIEYFTTIIKIKDDVLRTEYPVFHGITAKFGGHFKF